MKNKKSHTDVEALNGVSIPESVKKHIRDYFGRVIRHIGENYNPEESGWNVLLEKEDPLIDVTFLRREPRIKGTRTLVSSLKEFVDFDVTSYTLEEFVLCNDYCTIIFLIPKESWVAEELLKQLTSQLESEPENKLRRFLN